MLYTNEGSLGHCLGGEGYNRRREGGNFSRVLKNERGVSALLSPIVGFQRRPHLVGVKFCCGTII